NISCAQTGGSARTSLLSMVPFKPSLRRIIFLSSRESGLEIFVENDDELIDNGWTFQSGHQTSVNVNLRLGLFFGTRQRYSDIGMFGFARVIHDASHDSNLQSL